jgi:hypothetical protein
LLLERASALFEKVQLRIDAETPSKHWSLLKLAVLNNQACIYSDFDNEFQKRIELEKLAFTLGTYNDGEANANGGGAECRIFNLTLLILRQGGIVAAAA